MFRVVRYLHAAHLVYYGRALREDSYACGFRKVLAYAEAFEIRGWETGSLGLCDEAYIREKLSTFGQDLKVVVEGKGRILEHIGPCVYQNRR